MKTRRVGKRGRRPKRNPKRICFCCGEPITHKALNAIYCKKCSKMVKDIKTAIRFTRSRMRKKYPETKIKIKIDVTRKVRKWNP